MATAHDDGGVRLWDPGTARLLATLMSFADDEYLATTPGGAYTGTPEAADRVRWTFESPLESFTFEQYSAEFRDEALVKRRLAGQDVDVATAVGRPPRVTLMATPDAATPVASVRIRARVESPERVDVLRAFVEGRPVSATAICAPSGEPEIEVPLLPGQNRITITAFDQRGFSSNPVVLNALGSSGAGAKPDLWIVAVGVSAYPGLAPEDSLHFAAEDARAIAQKLVGLAGQDGTYDKTYTELLVDAAATPVAIQAAVGRLAAMRPQDIAIVFLSGHGLKPSDSDDMQFLTSEIALDSKGRLQGGVAWSMLAESFARARGRVVLLLDACHSGHILQQLTVPNDELASALVRSERAGVLVFTASKGRQKAYEPGAEKGVVLASVPQSIKGLAGDHSLFTDAILRSLQHPATDRDGDGAIQISELLEDVTVRVSRISMGEQTPWVPRREIFGDFRLMKAPPKR